MKLLLTSSGNTNKSIENSLLELLGKPFNKTNLVFIPTAANVEEDTSGWLETDINNFKKLGFNDFDVIDISKVKKEVWLPLFKKADALVFGGGNVEYLMDWIKKVGLDTLLLSLIKTKVYVGISAGSMIAAKNVSLSYSGILYYEDTGGFENIKGLGYVNFETRPHLNSKSFPEVKIEVLENIAKKMTDTFYAIDDNTAVKINNNDIAIITEGEWKKFN